jgi:uncharacterized protein DUF3606
VPLSRADPRQVQEPGTRDSNHAAEKLDGIYSMRRFRAIRRDQRSDKETSVMSDRNLISLTEEHEVRYWTKTLGVSEQRLREVVKQVGHSAAKVRAKLGMKEESTEGNSGPTGSGGVASESASPGPIPKRKG